MLEKLQCENCGGKLIEKDGVFVCESCGIGYKMTEEKKSYRDPILDNTIRINGIDPSKVSTLASEFSRLANFGTNLRR